MSFQAYLDNVDKQTGKTPNDFIALAKERGFSADTKAGEIITWLKEEHGLGHGHAQALAHVIQKGPVIEGKNVLNRGSHSDETETLRLDGVKKR
jgi:hypothetical protein